MAAGGGQRMEVLIGRNTIVQAIGIGRFPVVHLHSSSSGNHNACPNHVAPQLTVLEISSTTTMLCASGDRLCVTTDSGRNTYGMGRRWIWLWGSQTAGVQQSFCCVLSLIHISMPVSF